MTTINSYSVSLGLSATGLIDGSKLARNEISSLTRAFNQLSTPAEKVTKQLNLLEKAVDEGAIRESVYREAVARLTASVRDNSAELARNAEAQRKANQLASEGASLTRRLMTAEEVHSRELRRVNDLYRQGAINATTRSRAIAELSVKLAGASNAERAHATTMAATTKSTGSLTSAAMMLGSRVFAVGAIFSAVKGSINIAANAERAKADFTTLTGSAQMAMTMLGQMRKLADTSPLSFTGVQQAGQTLLSFGMDASQVIPTLKMIGDITGGNSDRFKMLSLAFAQTQAAGRLMGQDLLQMINAGFNPLQQISKDTGKSLVQLKKDMEDGAISAEMVVTAFKHATSEGGLFENRLANAGKTTKGAMDSAWSSIEKIGIGLGESISPLTNSLIGLFNQITPALQPVVSVVGLIGKGLGFVVALISDTIAFLPKVMYQLTHPLESVDFGSNTTAFLDRMDKAAVDAEIAASGVTSAIAGQNTQLGKQLTLSEQVSDAADRRLATEKAISALHKSADDAVEGVRGQLDVERYGKLGADKLRIGMERMTEQQRQAADAQRYAGAPLEDILSVLDSSAKIDLSRLETMHNQLDALREQKRLEEERIKDSQRMYEQLTNKAAESGRQLRESLATPAERLAKSLADIRYLSAVGAITANEADRAIKEELSKSVKDLKIDTPRSMELGSAEAYKYLTEGKTTEIERQIKIAMEQKNLAQAQVDATGRVEARLKELADVSPRRAR